MIRQIKHSKPFVLPKALLNELSSKAFAFNPSLIVHNSVTYIAFRIYDATTKSILALIYVLKDDEVINRINLSETFFEKENISKVADPKLFVLNSKVYCTFNTGDGNKINGNNKIFIATLDEKGILEYYICEYSQRQRTEKNWAFYSIDNTLYALYSLEPLTILKAAEVKPHAIVFESHFRDTKQHFKNYSIGTPLCEHDGKFMFIAHKKYYRNRKRLYLGKPCELDITNTPKLKRNTTTLLHSFKSIFGNKHKFNKNLISCTYFSGIQKYGHNLVVSYGINDVNWNIALVKTKQLWP